MSINKTQADVLRRAASRKFHCSQFDVADAETRERVEAAVERWFDSWVREPVLAVADDQPAAKLRSNGYDH